MSCHHFEAFKVIKEKLAYLRRVKRKRCADCTCEKVCAFIEELSKSNKEKSRKKSTSSSSAASSSSSSYYSCMSDITQLSPQPSLAALESPLASYLPSSATEEDEEPHGGSLAAEAAAATVAAVVEREKEAPAVWAAVAAVAAAAAMEEREKKAPAVWGAVAAVAAVAAMEEGVAAAAAMEEGEAAPMAAMEEEEEELAALAKKMHANLHYRITTPFTPEDETPPTPTTSKVCSSSSVHANSCNCFVQGRALVGTIGELLFLFL